jgi:hypothetical protein
MHLGNFNISKVHQNYYIILELACLLLMVCSLGTKRLTKIEINKNKKLIALETAINMTKKVTQLSLLRFGDPPPSLLVSRDL